MVEITVKAADSASAMEEIEKRLGADAMIVSTNRVDGQIEIVATNDDPSKYQKAPEPLVLDKNYRIKGFSDVLNSKLSAEDKPLKSEVVENYSEIAKNAENIKLQIDQLVELSSRPNEIKEKETSVFEAGSENLTLVQHNRLSELSKSSSRVSRTQVVGETVE